MGAKAGTRGPRPGKTDQLRSRRRWARTPVPCSGSRGSEYEGRTVGVQGEGAPPVDTAGPVCRPSQGCACAS